MSDDIPTAKLWAGRFTEPTDSLVERFTESVSFDRRLAKHDIRGSIAHATMLAEVGVLSEADRNAIVAGLDGILADIEAGVFEWRTSLEDVHMNVESVLTDRIGDAGKRLHTGRSRNDQVATGVRMLVRGALDDIVGAIRELQSVILSIAERESDTVLPGFTHLQPAQPITFGHHMLAWFEMLDRDAERLTECRVRANRMPLGAAALAGTTYPIDRAMTARLLGFDGLCENSLDAVSDRDFAIEFVCACALAMVHLSRMSEELVLWVSAPFSFVELGDAYCTGSSIMPQKKNPDVPELVRGKSARVIGNLNALLVLMKGQPLAYNRDNQEDKEPLFRHHRYRHGLPPGLRRHARHAAMPPRTNARGGASRLHDRNRSRRLSGPQGGAVPRRPRGGRARGAQRGGDRAGPVGDDPGRASDVLSSHRERRVRGADSRRLGGRAEPSGRHRPGPGACSDCAGEGGARFRMTGSYRFPMRTVSGVEAAHARRGATAAPEVPILPSPTAFAT